MSLRGDDAEHPDAEPEALTLERTTGHERGIAETVFPGDSEMAALCRALDWTTTPLGPVEDWPLALRTMVRSCLESPFPICLWCGAELTLLYNDGYARVLGTKHPLALGRAGSRVWAEVWPTLAPLFDGMRAGGGPVYRENARFMLRRDGEERAEGAEAWFTYSLSPVREETGEVVAFLNILFETTRQKKAETDTDHLVRALEVERSRIEYLFRHAPTFLAVLRGPAHVFELVNDAYHQLVGHRALVGMSVADALPEIRDQGFVELLDRVLETGEPFRGQEIPVQVQRTPGAPPERRILNLAYLPFVEADGTRSGIIAHGTDVTDQVVARQETERLLGESERARAEADAANRTKSEFLATMSHEFRTPLNAILGYAQLLDMGVLGPATQAQHEHLERLQQSARHLLQLVDDVLDVAKVDADRLRVRRDVLITETAVGSAIALIQPQATSKGVRLFDLSADTPGAAYIGDEHRVRQILVNLLSNAVKFTPAGGEVRITCGVTTDLAPGVQPGGVGGTASGEAGGRTSLSGEGAWAFVQVEDTGPGIAPELIGRMFEPFVQGDSALTREKGGTGLGLAISRRLARLMGGDLTVLAHSGPGASFTLWVPAAAGDLAAAEASPLPSERTRTPVSLPVFIPGGPDSSQEHALDDTAFAVLHALGVRLARDAETVAERYVVALRADAGFPGVRDLPTVQLRNHATPAIGLIATQLMVIGETKGQAAELLGDGGQVQRLMDELHGTQRLRLGWSEADIERETPILLAEIERALREAVDVHTAGPVAARAGALLSTGDGISPRAVSAATKYAADVIRHVLERGTRTSIRAYRFAKAAAGR